MKDWFLVREYNSNYVFTIIESFRLTFKNTYYAWMFGIDEAHKDSIDFMGLYNSGEEL